MDQGVLAVAVAIVGGEDEVRVIQLTLLFELLHDVHDSPAYSEYGARLLAEERVRSPGFLGGEGGWFFTYCGSSASETPQDGTRGALRSANWSASAASKKAGMCGPWKLTTMKSGRSAPHRPISLTATSLSRYVSR